MSKPVVYMFSGQGSQYYGMGSELFLINPTFRNWMMELDSIFSDVTGESVLKVLYESGHGKSELFDNILYTHPAIFMVEYSLAQALIECGIYPDYVLGSSLGEFTACAIGGVMSYEDIIECVIKQALIFQAYCPKGEMMAILNDYRLFEEEPILYNNSFLVSVNYDSHFVISGSVDGMKEIEKYLKACGHVFQKLPVEYAFHSPLMDDAAPSFSNLFKSKAFKTPEISYISSLRGTKVTCFDNSYFWDVVRNPIDFRAALRSLDNSEECIYIDLGPSGTLANFTGKILGSNTKNRIFSIISPFSNDIKNFENLLRSIHLRINLNLYSTE